VGRDGYSNRGECYNPTEVWPLRSACICMRLVLVMRTFCMRHQVTWCASSAAIDSMIYLLPGLLGWAGGVQLGRATDHVNHPGNHRPPQS
jgi:hypothetical protein